MNTGALSMLPKQEQDHAAEEENIYFSTMDKLPVCANNDL